MVLLESWEVFPSWWWWAWQHWQRQNRMKNKKSTVTQGDLINKKQRNRWSWMDEGIFMSPPNSAGKGVWRGHLWKGYDIDDWNMITVSRISWPLRKPSTCHGRCYRPWEAPESMNGLCVSSRTCTPMSGVMCELMVSTVRSWWASGLCPWPTAHHPGVGSSFMFHTGVPWDLSTWWPVYLQAQGMDGWYQFSSVRCWKQARGMGLYFQI